MNQNNQVVNLNYLSEPFKNNLSDGSTVKFESECHFAMQALNNNSFLQSTARNNPKSLEDAILNVASTDISLNPIDKHSYLVPMDGKVNLFVSYKGLVAIACRSDSIEYAQVKLVYENDTFAITSVYSAPTHEFKPFGDRGKLIGVYCVVKTKNGDCLTDTMSVDDCLKIRNRTKIWMKSQKGPWKDFPEEMIKKTMVRRASKMWPQNQRLDKVVHHLNQTEGIDFDGQEEKKSTYVPVDYEKKNLLIESIYKAFGAVASKYTKLEKMKYFKEVTNLNTWNDLIKFNPDKLQEILAKINETIKRKQELK